jgi:hypothetical protein
MLNVVKVEKTVRIQLNVSIPLEIPGIILERPEQQQQYKRIRDLNPAICVHSVGNPRYYYQNNEKNNNNSSSVAAE